MLTRLLLVVALVVAACTPTRRREIPAPPVDPTRLDHVQHSHVPCGTCHRDARRPGTDDHKPCDDEKCHKKEFAVAPGKVCKVCHVDVATTERGLVAELKKYPVEDLWQAMPPVFSHAKHMDHGRMEAAVGFHVSCKDCHTRGDDVHVRPNHATCARCHAPEVGLPKAPKMADCNGCHRGIPRPRTRPRLTEDLEFSHDAHRRDLKGTAIRCEDCHKRSARSTSYGDHAPPRVESCVGCHDDTARVSYEHRMRICETCHRDRAATLTALAPRSHLPSTERPLDHTLAFRRDHAEAAANSARRCAGCHIQMSGNPKQACDECHQRMLPADHRITYRELDHGPDAVADRSRCARCHVVEFCTACHAQRPRSHGIVGSFDREHARLARLNPRPCITCHGASRCSDAPGCHTNAMVAPRR